MILVAECSCLIMVVFFFNDTATTEIYTLSLHDALPISCGAHRSAHGGGVVDALVGADAVQDRVPARPPGRSEEHTSELQSRLHLVCRLLLEKKKKTPTRYLHCSHTTRAAARYTSIVLYS